MKSFKNFTIQSIFNEIQRFSYMEELQVLLFELKPEGVSRCAPRGGGQYSLTLFFDRYFVS